MKINKYVILYAILIIAFFPPGGYLIPVRITRIPVYISSIVILLMYIKAGMKIEKRIFAMALFFLYSFIGSSLLNYGSANMEQAFRFSLSSICFLLLAEMGLAKRPKVYLQSLIVGAGIPSAIHLYTMFKYASTHGMRYGYIYNAIGISRQAWYYFTHANASFFILFPIMVVVCCYLFLFDNKRLWVAYLLILVNLFGFAYANSTTSMIVLVFFAAYTWLLWNPREKSSISRKINKMLGIFTNKWVLLCIILLAVYLIVFAHITDRFAEVIVALGKSTDLTHRFPIWDKSIGLLMSNPTKMIWGFGWEKELVSLDKLGINHCHNIILEIVYRGGLIGLVLFFWFTIQYLSGLKNTTLGRLLAISLFTVLLCSVMDFYLYRFEVFLLYVLIYNEKKLTNVQA